MSFCSKGRIWIGILPILIPVGYETVFEAVRFVRRMFSCERDVFEDCVTMHCLEGRGENEAREATNQSPRNR